MRPTRHTAAAALATGLLALTACRTPPVIPEPASLRGRQAVVRQEDAAEPDLLFTYEYIDLNSPEQRLVIKFTTPDGSLPLDLLDVDNRDPLRPDHDYVLEFPLKGIQLTRAIESRLGTGADRVRVHLRETEVDTTDVYVRSGGAGRVEIVIRFGNYWGSFEIANRPTG